MVPLLPEVPFMPIPLSPVITDSAFNSYPPPVAPNELPIPSPPPPPAPLAYYQNHLPQLLLPPPPTMTTATTATQTRGLLRDRGARHPPRIPRLRRVSPPGSSSYDAQIGCLSDDCIVDIGKLCGIDNQIESQAYSLLQFDVEEEDGGRYSASYGVENMLRNDNSVYCSARSGTINISLRYHGKTRIDQTAVISQIIIKAPQYGFTAPCKDGMVFVSSHPINVERTRIFDRFTNSDYESYMDNRPDDGMDPIAWFTLTKDRQVVIPVDHRPAKYVLVKLIRSEQEVDNIDIQYLGFVGYSGARSFSRGLLH